MPFPLRVAPAEAGAAMWVWRLIRPAAPACAGATKRPKVMPEGMEVEEVEALSPQKCVGA